MTRGRIQQSIPLYSSQSYNLIRNLQNILRYFLIVFANIRFFIGDILELEYSSIITITTVVIALLSVNYCKFNISFYIVLFIGLICNKIFGGPNGSLIITFFIASALAYGDFRKICFFSFILQLCFFIVMLISVGYGILSEDINESEKGITRDLGFGNANTLSMFISSIIYTAGFVFLRQYHKRYIIIFTLPIIVACYLYSHGRTFFIGEMLFVITLTLICINKHSLSIFRYIITLFPVFSLTAILTLLSSNIDLDFLNQVFTGRPRLWFNHLGYFLSEGNLWLGYDYTSVYDIALDCSYLTLFVDNGIIGYLLYSLFMYKGSKNCFIQSIYYIPLICGVYISAIMENILLPLSPVNLLFITLMYRCFLKIDS